MDGNGSKATTPCPDTVESVTAEAREAFEALLGFCQEHEGTFWDAEQRLLRRVLALGCLFVRLLLASRHWRLDLEPFLAVPGHRMGQAYATRKLKTVFGTITFGRTHLIPEGGGCGFHPLDAVLGLTRDGFSPWMIQFVTRLATRMSYQASQLMCKAVLGWSPSTEAIEHLVLGLGRQAVPFMEQRGAPPDEGEVLVIEMDGKCPPTATEAELSKRRGKRRHTRGCRCGCQRHRGKAKRQARGAKRRRKKGDHSKNGKEVTVVVMYTLRRGDDGKLHGPLNKRIWGTFRGKKAAVNWARAEATRRGFDPETTRVVQIVVDGAQGLRENLGHEFPRAIFTLDVCHVVEKLWDLGHQFHAEGSEELKAQVEEWKQLIYRGDAAQLVKRLRAIGERIPATGPGTKGKREAVRKLIGYLEKRLEMMRYDQWREQDLPIASGQVEGGVRHLVGERMDCAGMRWIPQRAEALLHLRCIELNGDWERFIEWAYQDYHEQVENLEVVQIRTNEPIELARAA